MIIIRDNRVCPDCIHEDLKRKIFKQAESGLIVIPEYCELLHADPGDNKVKIKRFFIDENGKLHEA